MPKVLRATTPLSHDSAIRAPLFRLPAALVGTAARRLCWVYVICAVTTGFLFLIEGLLQPEVAAARQREPAIPLMALFLVLASIAMVAVQRYSLLSSQALLNLGLLFQVLVAFVIAFLETSSQIPPDEMVRGCSMVAVWITACGLFIPNTPLLTCLTAFASALMWPLAYHINVEIHGFQRMAWNRLVAYQLVNFTMAVWAYFLNRRIYSIEMKAQRVQEMGSYELLTLLGRGGMGEVWRARHRLLARDAAIKVIRPEVVDSQPGRLADIVRRRFEREARATANLRSPHTIDLYDFGAAQDGSFYYVMELLDGINLQRLVEKFGPVPAPRTIYILRQVCDSLEEAHRAGMVHRDIKPTNLYLCALGLNFDFVKVLDFGLVKRIDSPQATLVTAEGTAAGTPAYMAPEIAMGEQQIDGRADLYSLGCVAYFLLTGAILFEESTPTATAVAHVQKTPVPPSQRTELPIPEDLEALVMGCLAKQPDERPRSAQELGRRLEALACAGQWGQAEAARWWQTHLPVSSSERSAAAPTPAGVAIGADQ